MLLDSEFVLPGLFNALFIGLGLCIESVSLSSLWCNFLDCVFNELSIFWIQLGLSCLALELLKNV